MEAEQLINCIDSVVFHKTQRHLRDIEVWILKESCHGRTYEEIATQYNYTTQYLCQDIGPKLWKLLSDVFEEEVGKRNFRTCIERYLSSNFNFVDLESSFKPQPSLIDPYPGTSPTREWALDTLRDTQITRYDWADAPDIEPFYGRDKELKTLVHWVSGETESAQKSQPYRVVVLTGMGGIGKTKLALKLSHHVSKEFNFIIWRSLRNGPDVSSVVESCLETLSIDRSGLAGKSLEVKICHLLDALRKYRCLLVLDNFDSVIAEGSEIGAYQPIHAGYGLLVRCLADSQHRSCLVITTREKPQGLAHREGAAGSVKFLAVKGTQAQVAELMLQDKGCYDFDDESIQEILRYYGGNPLFINIIASSIREILGGQVKGFMPFIQKGLFHSHEIQDLLQQQILPLSDHQKQLLYWISSHSGHSTFSELLDSCQSIPAHRILADLQVLLKRSLLERDEDSLSLLPFITEYLSASLQEDAGKNAYPKRSLPVSPLQIHSPDKETAFGKKVAA
jgi:NB-ARC domain